MSERTYRISARAKTAMEQELSRFPDTETGGLLLGYSDPRGVTVMEATDSGYQNTVHEPCCFQYDDAYVRHLCTVLSELYLPPLDVVGIWHKHNSPCPVAFSRADEALHEQLLRQFAHPCLSILFEKTGSEEEDQLQYDVRVFELNRPEHREVSRQVTWQGASFQNTEGGSTMGEYNTCGKCAYWVHGVCQMTKESKNDTICTCGQFKERKEIK